MRIHPPQIQSTDSGRWRIAADVQSTSWAHPRQLWFELGSQSGTIKSPPTPLFEPFVLTLLLLAMQRRETLFVDGPLCSTFERGLEQIQKRFQEWYPNRFSRISIQSGGERRLAPLSGAPMTKATAFSSGVDSFYTLLTESPDETLFVAAGFDMPARNADSVAELTESTRILMAKRGVKLWTAETNAREFVDSVDWTNVHGMVLAACALFLESRWSQFVIPTSYLHTQHPKWGTHPELDPYFSTGGLHFIHPREEADRLEKLRVIANHPESYSRLRVCWIQNIGLRNCGECEKCIRTMTALELLGVRKLYTTFPFHAWRLGKLWELPQRTAQSRIFTWELIRHALKMGRMSVAIALFGSLARRRVRRMGRGLKELIS